jgi:GDPmannose 4,6-dehydratase
MKKTALIIGIAGQDGFYLAKFLLAKSYEVVGMDRNFSGENFEKVKNLSQNYDKEKSKLSLVVGDLTDTISLQNVLRDYKPDEIYNLGVYHTFEEGFCVPEVVGDLYGIGTMRLLESVDKICRKSKVFNLIPLGIFADTKEHLAIDENSLRAPLGPLNVAKNYAYELGKSYRKTHRMYISHGFVPERYSDISGYGGIIEKIAEGLSRVTLGIEKKFEVTVDLDQEYEWGYVGDMVEAMWLSVQQYAGDDYILGVGEVHSVRDFVKIACDFLELNVKWTKEAGQKEVLMDKITQKIIMEVQKSGYKAFDSTGLKSESAKAKRILGWQHKTSFEKLANILIEHNYNRIKRLI